MRTSYFAALVPVAAVVLGGCGVLDAIGVADDASVEFHRKVERGEAAAVYAAASPEFRAKRSEKEFVDLMTQVKTRLGPMQDIHCNGSREVTTGDTKHAVMPYRATFARGSASEVFTYQITGSKTLLLDYSIRSPQLGP